MSGRDLRHSIRSLFPASGWKGVVILGCPLLDNGHCENRTRLPAICHSRNFSVSQYILPLGGLYRKANFCPGSLSIFRRRLAEKPISTSSDVVITGFGYFISLSPPLYHFSFDFNFPLLYNFSTGVAAPNTYRREFIMSETIHDLTLLYLHHQDLSSFSPEELYDKYKDTYDKINIYHKSKKGSSMSILK